MNNSQMKCLNCNIVTHNIQCYNILIIPLEEVRKYKNISNNEVNIYDCFDYDKKDNVMSGENSMYCNICKMTTTSKINTYLVTGPKILILMKKNIKKCLKKS